MRVFKEAQHPPAERDAAWVTAAVAEILRRVAREGDAALRTYSAELDAWSPASFRLGSGEIDALVASLPDQVLADIDFAQAQIRRFALAQREALRDLEVQTLPGVTLGHRNIPVQSAACYAPGGRYPLVASAHMGIVTARAAGVERVVGITPPCNGAPHAATVAAMQRAGADEIYVLGGAHALAAFAYGTQSIRPVDMIVGPGNAYVAEAKRQLFGTVGIDLLAGPTEVLVIADDAADAEIVAADLLGQAEHGPDSVAVLVTSSETLARNTLAAIESQLESLATAAVAGAAWHEHGRVLLVSDEREAAAVADEVAAEHVEVLTRNPRYFLERLRNYGALFLGEATNVAYGDKLIGTNHVLPTARAARYTGGLWVGKFLKTCTYQELTREASLAIAPTCSRLCALEGFAGHKEQADVRVRKFSAGET